MDLFKENKEAIKRLNRDATAIQLYLAIQLAGGRVEVSKAELADMSSIELGKDAGHKYETLNRAIKKLESLSMLTKASNAYVINNEQERGNTTSEDVITTSELVINNERTRDYNEQERGNTTSEDVITTSELVINNERTRDYNEQERGNTTSEDVITTSELVINNERTRDYNEQERGNTTSEDVITTSELVINNERTRDYNEQERGNPDEIRPPNLKYIKNNNCTIKKFSNEHLNNKIPYNKLINNKKGDPGALVKDLGGDSGKSATQKMTDFERLTKLFFELQMSVHGRRLFWDARQSKVLGDLLAIMGAELLEQAARELAAVVKAELAKGNSGKEWWQCEITPHAVNLRKDSSKLFAKSANTHYGQQELSKKKTPQEAWDARSKIGEGKKVTRADISLVSEYFGVDDIPDELVDDADLEFIENLRKNEVKVYAS